MNRREIALAIINRWPYWINGKPESFEPYLWLVEKTKAFGNRYYDAAEQAGISAGLAKAVREAIKASETVDRGSLTGLTAAERCDRYLRENRARMR